MQAHLQIAATLERYFDGIYRSDVAQLASVFHPAATLFADVKGVPSLKPVRQYLEAVRTRISPQANGEERTMTVISTEVLGNVALAKTHCRMLGFNYYDFLSLQHLDGEWQIVCKVFTHVEPD
jgi:ketosteroid isomerase-like protein